MKSQRQLQIGEVIKRNISEIFLREDILSLPGSYVTILEADVSPDAKNVRIYIDIFGNEKIHEKIVEKLNAMVPHFRYLLAKKITSRGVPELKFILDKTAQNVTKIESLLAVEAEKYNAPQVSEKKVQSKKPAAKKSPAKKTPAKKLTAKKPPAKKTPAKKLTAKKPPAKKPPAKKPTGKKSVKKKK